MDGNLENKKIAILVEKGFEQIEMTEPREALEQAGASTVIISPQKDKLKAWNEKDWGQEFRVDVNIDDANPEDYDALLLPGGVMNPDYLRMNEKAVNFTRHFLENNKPVAAICHGPWLLVETGMIKGRTMTSYPSIKTDLMNAGANWVDEEVVVDNGLVTSRKPDDLPAFCEKMLEEVSEGVHEEQKR